MDDTYNQIDVWRQRLYVAMNNNKNFSNGVVLELSQKLDKLILEAYKKQLV